jgi:hypothetical protein
VDLFLLVRGGISGYGHGHTPRGLRSRHMRATMVLVRALNRINVIVLAATLWHATYRLLSATTPTRSFIGAVTTTCVMVYGRECFLSKSGAAARDL